MSQDIKMCAVYINLLSFEHRPEGDMRLEGVLGQIVK